MRWAIIFIAFCLAFSVACEIQARSAFSPRHTGLEPPGGPRNLQEGGRPIMRTPMGGMGYTDAYGNTIDDVQPEEKKVKRRRVVKETQAPRPLPDPDRGQPVWSFN